MLKVAPTLLVDRIEPSLNFLYIDVEDVLSLHQKLKEVEIVIPLQETFYGATHFFIREPGGHIIGFSQNKN